MTIPARRRVTAAMVDVVGSSKEKDRIGIARGNTVIKARLDEVAVALMVADPTATISPGEGGDSITVYGDPAAAAAFFKAAVEHQEVFWSLPVRIVIGAGDLIEDDQHRARFLDRIGKLKSVCEPGEVVVTEAIFEAVADDGRGHLLTSASTTLPDLGKTMYWYVGERSTMPPRDDEEQRYARAGQTLEAIEQRLQRLESNVLRLESSVINALSAAKDCDSIAQTTKANVEGAKVVVDSLTKIVDRLSWDLGPMKKMVYGSAVVVVLGLIALVILLASGAIRVGRITPDVVTPAIAETVPGGETSR